MVKGIVCLSLFLCLTATALAEEGGKHEAKGGTPHSLIMEDVIIPVLMREDVQGYYSLNITIEPKDASMREELIKFGPRIRDAIIHDLFIVLPVVWSQDQQPQLETMKKRIEMVAKKATPENTVGEVIINAFQVSEAKKAEDKGQAKESSK